MHNKNILVCGIIKNGEKTIETNINLSKELGKQFQNYKIVIYENNSSDKTKSILNKYLNDEKCKIIMETIDEETIKKNSKIWAYTKITGSSHPCRIEQIANARNKLIDEINKDEYNDYQIVIMIDMDARSWSIEGVIDSISKMKNDKMIFYANSSPYYDYYALRSKHSKYNLLGPEIIGELFWQSYLREPLNLYKNNDLFPVYSAFNGIGVFPKDIFKHYRYDAIITPAFCQQYEHIIEDNLSLVKDLQSHIRNECVKFPGGEKYNNIYFKNNSGYDKPVVCEHVIFNFNLINNGYSIYINSNMSYNR